MVLNPSNKALQGQILKKVGRMCYHEVKSLCSDNYRAMLRDTSDISLMHFSWESIWMEISNKAPTLSSILTNCLPVKTKPDKKPIICVCAALISKLRNQKMCHVQSAISLLLHAGHAGSQVRCW